MYSVLVADDEPAARKHIETIIARKCPGYYVSGSVSNGGEALKKVRQLQPDVLITDIRMPVLNGIELVKRIVEEKEDIIIVLVSGYSDFSYAQSAIRLGVSDYILKPVVPLELQRMLENMEERLKVQYWRNRNLIIRKLCAGDGISEKIIDRYFPEGLYYAAIIRMNGLPCRFSGYGRKEIFSDINERMLIYGRDEREMLCICPHELIEEQDFLRLIQSEIEKQKSGTEYFTVVTSDEPVKTMGLADTIDKLYQTLARKLVLGKSRVIHLEEPGSAEREGNIQDYLYPLQAYCKKKNRQKAREEVKRLLLLWGEEERPQLWVENMFNHILYVLQEFGEKLSCEGELGFLIEEAFANAENMQELSENIDQILFVGSEENPVFEKMDTREYYEKVMKYIGDNFSRQLTLASVGREMGISQPYLSKLLRKYGDESFTVCLTRLRMERAKELMSVPGQKLYIKDIAEQVGYKDQFYFSRMFRAYTGKSPSDFYNG